MFEKCRAFLINNSNSELYIHEAIKEFNEADKELNEAESEILHLRKEIERLKYKEEDYNCLLKSEGEQLVFKISANVDEITNMVSIEGGGEYTIFVPDAFKTSEIDEENLSNLSHEILNILMGALVERYNREQKDGENE